jgi:hypothetical protein
MAIGYSTLDLAMLAIAVFVVFAALRTPKVNSNSKESVFESGGQL